MFQEQVILIGCNSSSMAFKIPQKLVTSNTFLSAKLFKEFANFFHWCNFAVL